MILEMVSVILYIKQFKYYVTIINNTMDILNPEEDFFQETNTIPNYDKKKYKTIFFNLLQNNDKAKIFFTAFLKTKNGKDMYNTLDDNNKIVFNLCSIYGSVKAVIFIIEESTCNYKKMIDNFKPSFQIFKLFIDIQYPNLIVL